MNEDFDSAEPEAELDNELLFELEIVVVLVAGVELDHVLDIGFDVVVVVVEVAGVGY